MLKSISNLTVGNVCNIFLEVYKDVCLVFTTALLFGWIMAWIVKLTTG